MTVDDRLGAKRQLLVSLARSLGARSIKVFGSTARGEARPDSDLDLLIDLSPGRSLLDLIAIEQAASELLGCKVEVVTPDGVSPYLQGRILAEAVPL